MRRKLWFGYVVAVISGFWAMAWADVSPVQLKDEHSAHGSSTAGKDPVAPMEDRQKDVRNGAMIYSMSCVLCHGKKGRGDGPSSIFIGPYSHPRPNDFSAGVFKFRSTESGQLPTLADLMRTIREGIPGFMPSFRNLGEDRIRQVALYIAEEFIKQELPTASGIKYVEHVGPYTYAVDSVKRGKKLYNELKCYACHGPDGRGAEVPLRDDRGLEIMPIDLTRLESFGNGISHEDIYRTIMTGLDGTPMPSYSDIFIGKEQDAWDLVHYILSLQGR